MGALVGVESVTPEGLKDVYKDFNLAGDALAERLHRISDRHYFWKSIGGVRDMLDWRAGFSAQLMGDVLNMRMGRSVAGTVRKFNPDPRVAQMFDHFTQYVGSCPEQSPAVLCGIAHMQTTEGIWYPKGGTRAVPEALAALGEELGVEFRTGTGVKRVLTAGGRQVRGVETDAGEVVELAAVVSNADSARTHRELLGEQAPTATARSVASTSSTRVFHSPHSGQRPSQRALCAPHSVQRCRTRVRVMGAA